MHRRIIVVALAARNDVEARLFAGRVDIRRLYCVPMRKPSTCTVFLKRPISFASIRTISALASQSLFNSVNF